MKTNNPDVATSPDTTAASDTASRRPLKDVLLSIVLPVYNEEQVLGELLDGVTRAAVATGARHEVIFVNDGSRDRSGEVLDQLAQDDARVRVVHFSRNFGHQAAVQAGLEHARGDAVVLMDSDMQDSPAAIARFVEEWQAGYDVVYALRVDRKENAVKRFLFASFHRLLSRIASTPIPADAGNFGLIDRRVVREIVALGERDRYLPGLRSWVGFRQTGVEVERLARYDDLPRVSLWGLWRLAKTAIFSFSAAPLSLFHGIGVAATAIFLAVGSYALICKLFTDLAIPGWTSHMLSGCFFGALNALGISVLGEYVVRIYDQVRARPLFLVSRTVNFDAANIATSQLASSSGDDPYLDVLDYVNDLLDLATECSDGTMDRPVLSTPPACR